MARRYTKYFRILTAFFIIALLLLFANIGYDYITRDQTVEPFSDDVELQSGLIDSLFNAAIGEFGLADSLITRTRRDTNEHGESGIRYSIILPEDLPIPVILHRVYQIFRNDSIVIRSNELEPNKKSYLEIFSDPDFRITASFTVKKDFEKEKGRIALLIHSAGALSDEEFDALLKIPEFFALLIPPSDEAPEIIDAIKNNEKDYIIYLNDEIEDIDFRLKDSYSEQRLKHSVKNIVHSFPRYDFYIVDHHSSFYNSPDYTFVKAEFEKNGKVLVPLNSLNILNADSDAQLIERFHTLWWNLYNEETRLAVVSAEELPLLLEEIRKLRRWGVTIYRAPYLLHKMYQPSS